MVMTCASSSSCSFLFVGSVPALKRLVSGIGVRSGAVSFSRSPFQGFRGGSNNRCFLNGVGPSNRDRNNSNFAAYRGGSNFKSDKSVLWNLIQDIEPLDVSIIQKDVSGDTLDAMKRTISGMLGLLPSDQFNVSIQAFWEPLSRLLVSSMMTGYTLRNAEYRLCLQRSLYISEDFSPTKDRHDISAMNNPGSLMDQNNQNEFIDQNSHFVEERQENFTNNTASENHVDIELPEGLGDLSPQAQEYIRSLQSQLFQASKELQESHIRIAALQMQNLVGEERNDLLDYLRSLDPEKVAELSEPTSPEVQEVIQQVIHGLLATLSPKMYVKTPSQTESGPSVRRTQDGDNAEKIENASLQFQPLVSVSRDYLARLLFWCMLLGHHIRGLEYRFELDRVFNFSAIFGMSGKKTCQSNDMI
eukprot:TRINITY_DN6607_c0_g1_i1.p1 TRINITY_DN6607_c0_g1~~TRINITY_DN6607_c0_g1_i1.p1  ORF type:complete len:416 (-),score=72.76 TRINITY_DN6607_c0_g1_i1:252-1499(-)